MPAISPHRLSELIGAIYDCAVDPHLWPDAMREICTDLRCAVGAINVIDLQPHRLRFVKTWNYDISRSETYADDLAFIQLQAPAGNKSAYRRTGGNITLRFL